MVGVAPSQQVSKRMKKHTYLGIYFRYWRQLILTPISYIKILKLTEQVKTDLLLLLLVTFNNNNKNDFTKRCSQVGGDSVTGYFQHPTTILQMRNPRGVNDFQVHPLEQWLPV